jgi:transcriptional regulator GlxA family with amidase domain
MGIGDSDRLIPGDAEVRRAKVIRMQNKQQRESQKSRFPAIASAFTVKPLPPLSPARRKEVLARRDAWLRKIDPASLFHRLFDAIPGLQFFAKDRQGKMMFMNQGNLDKFHTTDEMATIGLSDFELSPPSLAQSYVEDDARIYASGKPLLNHVELGFDEQGVLDWYVVNKLPIRSRSGEIIGIMGLSQSFQERCKLLSPFQSISKAVIYVQQNYQQESSIHHLARSVGVSARQLERKFKLCFGIGPEQFLIKARLLAACRQLSGSDHSLARIALECGFSDQSAFTRQFRRHLAMTPHEFRRSKSFDKWLKPAVPEKQIPAWRKDILARREAWLRRIDPACLFHRLFDFIPGLQFFAKDRRGKMMFLNQANREKFHTTDEMATIGLSDFDLNPPSLAQSYVEDDARIYASGEPLLNHVELGFDEQGIPEWSVVNKLPIRSRAGKIIGIMGFALPLQEQSKLPPPFQGISEVVSQVRQNYQQDISVGGLAQLAGLSVSQLDRKFKACFGIGPQQFLLKIRLLAACRQLTATDNGLAQIASECGFTHPSAFAYQFRRHLGLTPREFRRQRSLH